MAGWDPYDLHDLGQQHMFPGLDLYYADPAQAHTMAGEELDALLRGTIVNRTKTCW